MHGFDSSEVVSMKLTIEVLTEVAENLENQAVTVRAIVVFLDEVLQNLPHEEADLAASTLKTINEQLKHLGENPNNIFRHELEKSFNQCFKINKIQ